MYYSIWLVWLILIGFENVYSSKPSVHTRSEIEYIKSRGQRVVSGGAQNMTDGG